MRSCPSSSSWLTLMHRVLFVPIVLLALAASGCDLFGSDEPEAAPTTMLTFTIEASKLPADGWLYWYVNDRVLYRLQGEGFGPIGVTADCGSHAGIASRVSTNPQEPDAISLIIETVEGDGDDPSVAREDFDGPGEHQLAVLVTCP